MMAHTGDSAQMGYIFQASGIRKGRGGRENYYFGLLKGPKGLTDEKSGKRQCICSSLKFAGIQSYNQEICKG